MPEQFTVPQFIDAEDKVLGPLTIRQFIILLIGFLTDAILWKLLTFVQFLFIGIPIIVLAGIVAFTKINGQPFHYFLLNLIQTFKKPKLRVWHKNISDADLKRLMDQEPEPPPDRYHRKEYGGSSRLQELSLVVNTGGVYKPDQYAE